MILCMLFVVALLAGVVGALVGLGGGVILVPTVIFLGTSIHVIPQITPQTVAGLSVIMMIFTGLSSTLTYAKAKTVDYKTGWLFFIGSVPGAMLGAYLNKGMDLVVFNLLFGILLVGISIVLMIRDRLHCTEWFVVHGKQMTYVDIQGKSYVYGYPIWFALFISFSVGILSGLFGIGGGALLVPIMLILFAFPPHVAVSTSMFLVFLTSLVNSGTHILLGNINWMYALAVIPGGFIGAKFGAMLNRRLQSQTVVFALRIVLLLVGIRSIIDAIL